MRIFALRNVLRALSFAPIIAAFTLVQISEPFPRGWLDPSNAHYWPNLLRAVTFVFAGVILGMITYTMLRSISAERSVSGGHPRRKLYRHVTTIAVAHGFLIATLLFYIRERINSPLSPATPIAFVGLLGTFFALSLMLGYQNSRLQRYHAAKQVLGVIEPSEGGEHDLCIRVVGSTEPVSVREWLSEFEGGALALISVEKVEESPVAQHGFLKWLSRTEGGHR